MAYEKKGFIWTPTEATGYNYTSNLATMASSIETAVGKSIYFAEGTATPQNNSNFGPFSPGNVIKLTRHGSFVTVSCTWRCLTANYLRSSSPRNFAQIPVGFRPKYKCWTLYPISGVNYALLEVDTSGALNTSKALYDHGANAAMYIAFTYLAED